MWILSLGMKADADDGRGKGGFPFFCFSASQAQAPPKGLAWHVASLPSLQWPFGMGVDVYYV